MMQREKSGALLALYSWRGREGKSPVQCSFGRELLVCNDYLPCLHNLPPPLSHEAVLSSSARHLPLLLDVRRAILTLNTLAVVCLDN